MRASARCLLAIKIESGGGEERTNTLKYESKNSFLTCTHTEHRRRQEQRSRVTAEEAQELHAEEPGERVRAEDMFAPVLVTRTASKCEQTHTRPSCVDVTSSSSRGGGRKPLFGRTDELYDTRPPMTKFLF